VIVQAACLAHDIGNPPFGHAGEYAIQDWFRQQTQLLAPLSAQEQDDFKHWEGNAQGFRLVAQVEQHLFGGGLRLTYPTLASMLKYPWTVDHRTEKGKFACFQSEAPLLMAVAQRLGLAHTEPHCWQRHPLSYLMEAADDICYAIIDLEDAVELNILEFSEVRDLLCRINPEAEQGIAQDERHSPLRQLGALRGKAMQVIIDAVTEAFLTHHESILAGTLTGDLLAHCPEPVVSGIREAKSVAQRKIFKDRRKTEIEIGAYGTLSTLLEAFIHAGFELHQVGIDQLSYRSRRVIDLMQHEAPEAGASLYHIYQRMLDFITRQTDQYATALARQISGAAP
jgi:dGTPase